MYLKSPHWAGVRGRALLKAEGHCGACGRCCVRGYCRLCERDTSDDEDPEAMRLEVHHKTYERLGHELDRDVVAVCESCHEGLHELLGVIGDLVRDAVKQ